MTSKEEVIVSNLSSLFPNARCSLHFSTPFQCLISVMLSAQTTDEAVNKVTPNLFLAYPTAKEMEKAPLKDIERLIHSIGLYKIKALRIINISSALEKEYSGEVPNDFEALLSLPGVGEKTAGVVLAEVYSRPAIPVDTHIKRISYRLGYSKVGDSPLDIEKNLERKFDPSFYIPLHHQLIYFGRTICQAKDPKCGECPFGVYCSPSRRKVSTKAK